MTHLSRRELIKDTLSVALLPLTLLLADSPAMAQNPPLDPSEPTAKALGYQTASTKPDENCANCSLFKGKAGDAAGGCGAFPGKDVAAVGYCKAWSKKP